MMEEKIQVKWKENFRVFVPLRYCSENLFNFYTAFLRVKEERN
jgi:hypothetical protein